MGMFNKRAICPRCGGKVHTRSATAVRVAPVRPFGGHKQATGFECQHCGQALSGKVSRVNVAVVPELEHLNGMALCKAQGEWRGKVRAGRL